MTRLVNFPMENDSFAFGKWVYWDIWVGLRICELNKSVWDESVKNQVELELLN